MKKSPLHTLFQICLLMNFLMYSAPTEASEKKNTHLIPSQAMLGDGAEETNYYWCRHPNPPDIEDSFYQCTIYLADGRKYSDGHYGFFKSGIEPDSETLIAPADPEDVAFDRGEYKYDSGNVRRIYLDKSGATIYFFRPVGYVDVFVSEGQSLKLKFNEHGDLCKLNLDDLASYWDFCQNGSHSTYVTGGF